MPDDETLALKLQQGDRNSLITLVERHHNLLLGYLFRLCGGNKALAEDLVQETFLQVIKAIKQYQHPRPFKPWLYAIATNLTRDHFKRAEVRRTTTEADETTYQSFYRDEVTPEETALGNSERQEVARAIRQLPLHQRETLILRYYQELSLAEISVVLEIPVGTVKSRLSLGLARLREILEGVRNAE